MNSTELALELEGVRKSFGSHVAVDDFSLQVPRGSIYGFLGPNGAGKTTTIRMIMSIIYPDSGRLNILGHSNAEAVKDRLGYLPEEKGLYKKMKAAEILAYFGRLKGLPSRQAKKRAVELLERYGLGEWADKRCEALSKGMGQKIQILATMIHEPDLVILDEPFSGLDPVNVDVMRDLILDLKREGRTVMFSTHIMHQAEQLCDSIALIHKGVKVIDGSLSEVKSAGDSGILLDYDGDGSILTGLAGIARINDSGKQAEIYLEKGIDPQSILQQVVGQLTVRRFDLREPSLHEIFVRTVGGTSMASKALLVAQREYVENLRTKAFWIGILLFPVIITVMMVVPALLERNKSTRAYAVVDRSGWLLEAVEERAALPDLEKVFDFALAKVRSGEGADELPEALREIAEELDRSLEWVEKQQPNASPEELEDKVIGGFASTVAGFAGTEGAAIRDMLPEEATEPLARLRDSIRDWWLALPPEEAEQYGSGLTKSRYQRVDVSGTSESSVTELSKQVDGGELFAVFVVGEDPVGSSEGFRYLSANLTDDDLRDWFSGLASGVVRERRLEQKQIDKETAAWIQEPTRFAMSQIGEGGETKDVEAQDMVRQWAPVAFVYLLWISVFTIAQMLLTNTVEEKSNRLMEVLLSSVSPLQLMMGKILGIAATGMTMLISWLVFFYLATKFLPRIFDVNIGFDLSVIATDPVYIGSFLVYFLLGYLLYASLLVGIGSVCNSLKEAQNLMSPIMIVLFVPLVTMMPVGKDPNGLLAQVLSYIPLFTPFIMMNRAAGPPTAMEYGITTVLLVLTVAAAMWAAAKVFRIGVLMTGKPPRPLEILKWIKAPVGVVPNRSAE